VASDFASLRGAASGGRASDVELIGLHVVPASQAGWPNCGFCSFYGFWQPVEILKSRMEWK
jgi:hypothetical protein